MAVVNRDIERIEREAHDTLTRNRAAVAAAQQSVGRLRESRERSEQRVKVITRRLQKAGVVTND